MRYNMTAQEIYDSINNFVMNSETNTAVGNDILKLYYANKEDEAIRYIKVFFKCDDKTAEDAFNIFKEKTGAPPSQQQIAHANAVAQEWQNKPKCPTCNSTNIEKISLTKKAFGGAMFGLFSSDVRNSMHCKNCGAKW